MQRKLLTALVVVFGLAAVIALALFLGKKAAPSTAATPVAASGAATPKASAGPKTAPESDGPTLLTEDSDERSAAAAKEDELVVRTWDPAATVWVRGSVAIPRATPGDESLEVLAYDEAGDPTQRALSRTRVPEIGRDHLLAIEQVDPTGTFKIGLPPDQTRAWIVLRGRYLYSRAGVSVDPRAEDPHADFTPELGAWITGKVVLPRDASEKERDLASVEVEATADPMQFLGAGGFDESRAPQERKSRVDEELSFELLGVAPKVRYRLQAVPKLLAAAKSEKFQPNAGEHLVLSLPLARGARLAGRVVDAEGHGVGEARMQVLQDPVMFGQGGLEVRDDKSDADGTFELLAVASGKSKLRVRHDGFLDEQRDLDLADGQNLDGMEIKLERGNRIAGIVLWPDRRPVVDTEVNVIFDMSQIGGMGAFNAFQGAKGDGKTDAEGHFAVTGLGKGPFTVRVSAEPETPGVPKKVHEKNDSPDTDEELAMWRARADGVKPGTENLELVLEPPLVLAGHVTDDLGAPITAKFQVHARTKVGGMIPGMGSDTRTDDFEDPAGSFALAGLRRGTWEMWASAAGYGPGKSSTIELPPASDAAPFVLVIERAASVAGVVLGPDGSPFPGAKVTPERTMQNLTRAATQGSELEAIAGEDGKFVLTGLPSGNTSIVASAASFAESEPVPLEIAPAQPIEGVVLQMRVGGRLLGEVFDAKGKPAPGKTIMAQIPSKPGVQRMANSDGEGHFEMEHLAPGSWQVMTLPFGDTSSDVTASSDGGDDFARFFSEMKLTMAEIKDGEDTHVQLGAPPKNPVRVHGRVLLDGRPVTGVLVTFIADGFKGMEAMRFTNTDSKGAYEVRLNEPGSFLVSVQKLDGTPGQQQSVEFHEIVPEADEHELDFDVPVGGISGSVRGPDGNPASHVRVSLTTDGAIQNGSLLGGNYAEITTGDDGRFELVWLHPGTYSVSAGGSVMGGLFGSGEAHHGRQVKSGLSLTAGEWMRNVDFKLKAPGEVEGVVRDGSGAAVKDAAIFIRDEAGRPLERLSMTLTDVSGRFTYSNLEPGTYTVEARSPTQASTQPASVRVRSEEKASVTLTLDAATMLLVSLSDEEGKPVDCSVSVLDERGHQVNGLMSLGDLMEVFQKGTFSTTEQRIGPLAPGKYKVIATTHDGASSSKPVTLTGQPERKLNLRVKE